MSDKLAYPEIQKGEHQKAQQEQQQQQIYEEDH